MKAVKPIHERSLILNVLNATADAWLPMITLTPNVAAPTCLRYPMECCKPLYMCRFALMGNRCDKKGECEFKYEEKSA